MTLGALLWIVVSFGIVLWQQHKQQNTIEALRKQLEELQAATRTSLEPQMTLVFEER